jgi:transcriptional regulator with XRE-family HTH domain
MADEVGGRFDMRPLSERLKEKIPRGDWERVSMELGLSKNTISRYISLDLLPGPEKYPILAEYLEITVFEVGGAVALDQVSRRRARLSQ